MKLYMFQVEKRALPIRVHDEDLVYLVNKGYIEHKDNDEVTLTELGREIFELKEDLFIKFFETFPYRVPDGTGDYRILGTKSPDTILGNKIRKKWISITKADIELQKTIIKGLEHELEYRRRTSSLLYMQNMETWLNNGSWQKYTDESEGQQSLQKPNTDIL